MLLDKVVKAGWEGLVIKQPKMLWSATKTRTDAFIKAKKYPTYDLEVVDVNLGEGKYSGAVGSLILADATGRIVGSVGTGLSDSDRYDMDFIGQVVEIKCERISPDGMLIQPVYLHTREPKCLDTISV
jgi:DNA ligase-1